MNVKECTHTDSVSADAVIAGDKAAGSHSTHRDGGVFCASLSGVRVEEDIPAAPLAVLVDDEADLAGLQLRRGPAEEDMNMTENVAKLQHTD